MSHQDIVFYTVLGFFILIGLASLGVIYGVIKPKKDVRQLALRGFAASTTSVIFAGIKILDPGAAPAVSAPPPPPAPIHVVLDVPLEFNGSFKIGKFEYIETSGPQRSGDVVSRKGTVLPVVNFGAWEVVLPGEAADKATSLHLQDSNGGWWETRPFTPNYVRQQVKSGTVFIGMHDDSWHVPGVAVLAAAGPGAAAETAATVKLTNFARRIEDRYDRPFYEWRVFVDETPAVLDNIEQVDYLLHPTFPDPFQTTRNRANRFALEATGWGSFNVLVTIHYKNGTQNTQTYFVDLNKGWPAEAAKPPAASATQLKLETIQVFEDGTGGSTSWSFDVLLDGQLALRLPSKKYEDDKSGKRGTPYPADANRSILPIKIAPGKAVRLEVRGKRTNANDTATGQATVTASGGRIRVPVANHDPKKGSFVFLFAPTTS